VSVRIVEVVAGKTRLIVGGYLKEKKYMVYVFGVST